MPALTSRPCGPPRCVSATLLRTLWSQLVALQAQTPYRDARLARIADQGDYVLRNWPADQWPVTNRQLAPVPNRVELMRQLTYLTQAIAACNQQHISIWPLRLRFIQLLEQVL